MSQPVLDLNVFLNQHNLSKLSAKFAEESMTLDDLMNCTEGDIRDLCSEFKFSTSSKIKLMKAVKTAKLNKLSNTTTNSYTDEKGPPVEEKKDDDEMLELTQIIKYGYDKANLNKFSETAQCIICKQESLTNTKLYACKKCKDDRIFCGECGEFIHRKNDHGFDLVTIANNDGYIVCINDMVDEFDPRSVRYGQYVRNLIKRWKKMELYNKWLFSPVSVVTCVGAAQIASFASHGTFLSNACCGLGNAVLKAPLAAGLGGAGIGVAIGVAIEGAFICWSWHKGIISGKEAVQQIVRSLISNSIAAGVFLGCVAGGASLGTPVGPIGWLIGGLIGGIIAAVLSRWTCNKIFEKLVPSDEQKQREALQKGAIIEFFGKKYYKKKYIKDKKKFNPQILKKTYHKLCLKYHPDRNDGDQMDFLRISQYYGVLIAICQEMYPDKNTQNNNNNNDQINLSVQSPQSSQQN